MTPGTKVIALPFENGQDGVFRVAMKRGYFNKKAIVCDSPINSLNSMLIQFEKGFNCYWPTSALKPVEPNAPEQTILQELEQMQTKLNGIIKRLKENYT